MQRQPMRAAVFLMAAISIAASASAQEALTGDARLACEAVLCLASGQRPDECAPSLNRYFSISHRKLSDTIRARGDFLKLCPSSNQTQEMQSLVHAMANGAGRCDAAALNATLRYSRGNDDSYTYISNQLPTYCAAYASHAYTNLDATSPKYVGTSERGGYWAEAREYDRALMEYNIRIAAEDAARQNNF